MIMQCTMIWEIQTGKEFIRPIRPEDPLSKIDVGLIAHQFVFSKSLADSRKQNLAKARKCMFIVHNIYQCLSSSI